MAESSASTLSPVSPTSQPDRPGQIYHTNSQTWIDEILETARKRSVAMDSGQPLPTSLSPTHAARLSEHEGEGTESSADENTSMVRRQNSKRSTYQSTTSSLATGSNGPVKRRSAQERRPQQAAPEASDISSQTSWWKQQLEKIRSVELENKGSVARDHLAVERTFLAWLRTSLAFASIGIAVTQLFRLNTSLANSEPGSDPYYKLRQVGKPLGATFLGISIVVLFVGFHRYFESQHWIIRGKFPASRGSVALVAAIALALMATSLVIVIAVEPSAFEKRKR